jgi:hypothetical protein
MQSSHRAVTEEPSSLGIDDGVFRPIKARAATPEQLPPMAMPQMPPNSNWQRSSALSRRPSTAHTRVMDCREKFTSPAPLNVPWEERGMSSIHAIHGLHRHIGGRWRSHFDTGAAAQRQLERIERNGARNRTETWAVRKKLIEAYASRAIPQLRGSGFVEAYHLLKAALELSLYDDASAHLCAGDRGVGALPSGGRGTRLTALVLNNLAVYHLRRGQGKNALHHLHLAEAVESAEPSLSTQLNLTVLCEEMGQVRDSLAHARCLVRRLADERVLWGRPLPMERAAVIAVALRNLGGSLRAASDVSSAHWCEGVAAEISTRDLGPDHAVTVALGATGGEGSGSIAHQPAAATTASIRLGRSFLCQYVDGTTYSIGWPHFTLIDLQEKSPGLRRGGGVGWGRGAGAAAGLTTQGPRVD